MTAAAKSFPELLFEMIEKGAAVGKPKLSKAQAELLASIAERSRYCVSYYKPAIKLVELGLAEWGIVSGKLRLTDAGKKWLNHE